MSSQTHADRLGQALAATGLLEPVRMSFHTNQVVVLGRVHKNNRTQWIDLLERLEIAGTQVIGLPQEWQSHLCQRYFLKEFTEPDGATKKKIVFAWNISIQSSNMDASLELILKVLQGENIQVTVPGELTEMEMTGLDHERNVPNDKGRGVHHIGSDGGKKDFRPMQR